MFRSAYTATIPPLVLFTSHSSTMLSASTGGGAHGGCSLTYPAMARVGSNPGEFRRHLPLPPPPAVFNPKLHSMNTQAMVSNSPAGCPQTIAPTHMYPSRIGNDCPRHPCCSWIFLGSASREGIANLF